MNNNNIESNIKSDDININTVVVYGVEMRNYSMDSTKRIK